MHDAPTPKDEPVGWVVRPSGAVPSVIWLIRRLVRRVPRPVIALPGRDLYRVLICGRGFALPVEGERGEPTGFFTTRFVAARSRQDAESIALSRVRKDWSGWSLLSHLTGVEEPQLAVDETEALVERVRLRRGAGYVFFRDSPESGRTDSQANKALGRLPAQW